MLLEFIELLLNTMEISKFQSGPIETNCYLLHVNKNDAVLIDAAPDSYSYLSVLKEKHNFNLIAVLLTHTHFDHSTDAAILQSKMGAKIFVSPADEYRLKDPNKYTLFPLPAPILPCTPDGFLKENVELVFGNESFRILDTPGHTEGGVAIVSDSTKTVFCGDTLFREGVGRTDLPGGDYSMLVHSVREKLYALPDDYHVLPGHGPSTYIGYEKENNWYIPKIS